MHVPTFNIPSLLKRLSCTKLNCEQKKYMEVYDPYFLRISGNGNIRKIVWFLPQPKIFLNH